MDKYTTSMSLELGLSVHFQQELTEMYTKAYKDALGGTVFDLTCGIGVLITPREGGEIEIGFYSPNGVPENEVVVFSREVFSIIAALQE